VRTSGSYAHLSRTPEQVVGQPDSNGATMDKHDYMHFIEHLRVQGRL
jgi:hypothetical protein